MANTETFTTTSTSLPPPTGLLSNQEEKSINFYFIRVSLTKKVLKYGTPKPTSELSSLNPKKPKPLHPKPCTPSPEPLKPYG